MVEEFINIQVSAISCLFSVSSITLVKYQYSLPSKVLLSLQRCYLSKNLLSYKLFKFDIYRIGRTGRAGREGTAHTFFQQCDKLRAGELVKVLKEANQEVPKAMMDFDLSIKRKEHKLYGNFGPKDFGQPMKKATKITFDQCRVVKTFLINFF